VSWNSSTADLAIVGGTVVTDGWSGRASVVVDDGRVQALISAESGSSEVDARRVVDATGKFVMPGGVDPHCHVASHHGEFTTRDDFGLASMAALAGGTTTIIDFAIPTPVESPIAALDAKLQMGNLSRCDYALHGCIVAADWGVEDIIHDYVLAGVRSVKLYTTYRGALMVSPELVERVMVALKQLSGLTYVHAEENSVVEQAQAEAARGGYVNAKGMARTRPVTAEEQAVEEVLAVAERTGSPVYFVHQSTAGAVDRVVQARSRGVRAFAESCPHYLVLSDSCYQGEHPERYVCCPPLRDVSEVQELANRFEMGMIDTVGSDHCCYDTVQKLVHADDVRLMPNGMPGVETRMAVTWDAFVHSGRMTPEQYVAVTAANPAQLNGLFPRKGSIAPGSDADILILDPAARLTLRAQDLHMATDYTPFEQRVIHGAPTTVLTGGRVVLDDGELTDPGPVGRFVRSNPIDIARPYQR